MLTPLLDGILLAEAAVLARFAHDRQWALSNRKLCTTIEPMLGKMDFPMMTTYASVLVSGNPFAFAHLQAR